MSYGRHPYGGVGYAGSDVTEIPQADTRTALSVEVAFTTGALETPVWVDITADVRFWDVRRGRSRELERFQPGRATVVLGNRSGDYDNENSSSLLAGNVKPMRRIRIRETFNGVTYPVFDGFVDRWDLDYPAMGKDATATVTATDLFKILARTDLPPSVYYDEVLADEPIAWWRLGNPAYINSGLDSVGDLDLTFVASPRGGQAIVTNDANQSTAFRLPGGGDPNAAQATVSMPLTFPFTIELVYRSLQEATDGQRVLFEIVGNSDQRDLIYAIGQTNPGQPLFFMTADAGSTSSSSLAATRVDDGNIHHLAVVARSSTDVTFYLDGVDDTSTVGGTSVALPTGTVKLSIGNIADGSVLGAGGAQAGADGEIQDVAIYGEALSADRIAVHADAREHPWQDDQPDDRLGRVLDEAEWFEDLREIDSGDVALQSAELDTTALEHAQKVAETEFGLLFVTRAGVVRFVDRASQGARSPGPTVYGASAGNVGYRSIRFDDGDEVLRNSATISRLNGVAQTATGTTIDEFGRFQYTLDGLLHRLDSYSADYAQFVVDEYEDLRRRIVELTVGPVPDGEEALYYPAMLGPELGDAIDVTFARPVGGTLFEQTCVVEGIRHTSAPGRNRTVTFTLSPEFTETLF